MGDEDGAHHVPSSTNLFIGNLAPDIGTDALREMFEPFGDIESCTVMMDANTRTSRGFGFVKYRTPEHGKLIVLLCRTISNTHQRATQYSV